MQTCISLVYNAFRIIDLTKTVENGQFSHPMTHTTGVPQSSEGPPALLTFTSDCSHPLKNDFSYQCYANDTQLKISMLSARISE